MALSAIGPVRAAAQDPQGGLQTRAVEVQSGQKLKVEGVILDKKAGGLALLCPGGVVYNVTITGTTEIKERKKNPFRGSKKYSEADLLQGLQAEVEGTGDGSGSLVAKNIKLRNDDLEMAQSMDTRVLPVEKELEAAQNRLSETEQNAQRLSGQVQELSEVSNTARAGAQKAQESADQAMSAATSARTFAEERVAATNERISALDEYSVQSTVVVLFAADSADLSAAAKSDLQAAAARLESEKGYLVEVAGFTSSDGDPDYNRRLSQRRADSVIQYMAETFGIPLRRFVTPMGYGENQPVADNQTRAGRSQNRRVEVRVLVSKGLSNPEQQ